VDEQLFVFRKRLAGEQDRQAVRDRVAAVTGGATNVQGMNRVGRDDGERSPADRAAEQCDALGGEPGGVPCGCNRHNPILKLSCQTGRAERALTRLLSLRLALPLVG